MESINGGESCCEVAVPRQLSRCGRLGLEVDAVIAGLDFRRDCVSGLQGCSGRGSTSKALPMQASGVSGNAGWKEHEHPERESVQ